MDVIAYNPQKGRLETVKAHFAEENTLGLMVWGALRVSA